MTLSQQSQWLSLPAVTVSLSLSSHSDSLPQQSQWLSLPTVTVTVSPAVTVPLSPSSHSDCPSQQYALLLPSPYPPHQLHKITTSSHFRLSAMRGFVIAWPDTWILDGLAAIFSWPVCPYQASWGSIFIVWSQLMYPKLVAAHLNVMWHQQLHCAVFTFERQNTDNLLTRCFAKALKNFAVCLLIGCSVCGSIGHFQFHVPTAVFPLLYRTLSVSCTYSCLSL